MTPAEQYRLLALQLRDRAREAGEGRAELENLAQCYTRLADQADQNNARDQTYEPILRPPDDSEPRRDDG